MICCFALTRALWITFPQFFAAPSSLVDTKHTTQLSPALGKESSSTCSTITFESPYSWLIEEEIFKEPVSERRDDVPISQPLQKNEAENNNLFIPEYSDPHDAVKGEDGYFFLALHDPYPDTYPYNATRRKMSSKCKGEPTCKKVKKNTSNGIKMSPEPGDDSKKKKAKLSRSEQ